jgi:hypothetical protein
MVNLRGVEFMLDFYVPIVSMPSNRTDQDHQKHVKRCTPLGIYCVHCFYKWDHTTVYFFYKKYNEVPLNIIKNDLAQIKIYSN